MWIPAYTRAKARVLLWIAVGTAALAWLLLHKLAFLSGGLSASELKVAHQTLGWHGVYHNPLDLPLKLVRSIVFYFFPTHGQLLTRLPNVLFGGLSVIIFAWLVRLWHGPKPAVLTMFLFATSAWVLHVSRLASYDVLYLWAMPTLLLIQIGLHKHATHSFIWSYRAAYRYRDRIIPVQQVPARRFWRNSQPRRSRPAKRWQFFVVSRHPFEANSRRIVRPYADQRLATAQKPQLNQSGQAVIFASLISRT